MEPNRFLIRLVFNESILVFLDKCNNDPGSYRPSSQEAKLWQQKLFLKTRPIFNPRQLRKLPGGYLLEVIHKQKCSHKTGFVCSSQTKITVMVQPPGEVPRKKVSLHQESVSRKFLSDWHLTHLRDWAKHCTTEKKEMNLLAGAN